MAYTLCMSNFILPLVMVVGSLHFFSCGTTEGPCGPATCQGCCGASGICQNGVSRHECGADGVTCVDCGESKVCSFKTFQCAIPTVSDAGTIVPLKIENPGTNCWSLTQGSLRGKLTLNLTGGPDGTGNVDWVAYKLGTVTSRFTAMDTHVSMLFKYSDNSGDYQASIDPSGNFLNGTTTGANLMALWSGVLVKCAP